jgi:energy-coupling factor transporter ATP-binding protein EcfA2
MKRITVLFGNYGSGKTELSLNMALLLAEQSADVALVDLDIVNPYFRSSEHRLLLESKGIRVIAPVFANTAVDVPSLPPDVYAAFRHEFAVFDCGGDPVGAAALGGLKRYFDDNRADTEVLFVVNTLRPFQGSAETLEESLMRIQTRARLTADGLVLNANLGAETTGDELAEGYAVVQALSESTGIPLRYVSGTEAALAAFDRQCPNCAGERLTISILTRLEWMA